MKKEEAGEGSLIRSISGGLYKAFGFWFSELKTQLLGVSNESWGLVVFESGITREVIT